MAKRVLIKNICIVFVLIIIGIGLGIYSVHFREDNTYSTEPVTTSDGTVLNLVNGGHSFFADDILPDGVNAQEYIIADNMCGVKFPYYIDDTPFVVTRIAKYSGKFVEDNSGDMVQNCLAIVVQNNSKHLITSGTVIFKVNDSRTAVFKVEYLPSNGSCVLLEQGRMPFDMNDILIYDAQNDRNSYTVCKNKEYKKIDIIDKVQVSAANGGIELVNNSSEDYSKVDIWYKNYIEGIYVGGVAYNVRFDNVASGAKVTATTDDYDQRSNQIVAVVSATD